ncbi:hypothetical protein [Nitrosococcus oceani]|uniref:hypothetical protein n=1 Tax=Nitrosococcus oceani TaxID=1229 RepID=UPI0011BF7A24|nr:hypothetical protein [Nitrosococcus oceani]
MLSSVKKTIPILRDGSVKYKLHEYINRIFAIVLILVSLGYHNFLFSSETVVTVKERHEPWIMNFPGVVGTGIGDCQGTPCIKVYIKEKTPELEQQLPKRIEGFQLDIEVTGPIETQ